MCVFFIFSFFLLHFVPLVRSDDDDDVFIGRKFRIEFRNGVGGPRACVRRVPPMARSERNVVIIILFSCRAARRRRGQEFFIRHPPADRATPMLPRTRYRNTGSVFTFLTRRRPDENTDVPSAIKHARLLLWNPPTFARFRKHDRLRRECVEQFVMRFPFCPLCYFLCPVWWYLEQRSWRRNIFSLAYACGYARCQQSTVSRKTVCVIYRFRWKTYVYPLIYSSRRVEKIMIWSFQKEFSLRVEFDVL